MSYAEINNQLERVGFRPPSQSENFVWVPGGGYRHARFARHHQAADLTR